MQIFFHSNSSIGNISFRKGLRKKDFNDTKQHTHTILHFSFNMHTTNLWTWDIDTRICSGMLRFDNLRNNINILIYFLYFGLVLHMTKKVFSVSSEPLSNIYFLHSVPHLSLKYIYHLPVEHFQHQWLKNVSGFFRTIFGNFTVIHTPSIYFPLSSRFMCWDYLFMVSSDIFNQTSLMEEGISLASSCLLCSACQFVLTDLYIWSLFP